MPAANPGSSAPRPAVVPPGEAAQVRAAWAHNPMDVCLGLYNPTTGEIHVGSFDHAGLGMGPDGLQISLKIPDADRPSWRGFIVTSHGVIFNRSGFNVVDGTGTRMRVDYFAEVEAALHAAGLA